MERADFLRAATAIGDGLAAAGRGAMDALDPSLYAGRAGVALFLGNLAVVRGDARLREVARGLLDEAWAEVARGRRPLNPAFICGDGGVPFALLATGERAEAAQWFATLLERERVDGNELFYGAAGAGVTYLSAFRATGRENFLAAAVRQGERLERAAIRTRDGCSWSWGGRGFAAGSIYVGFSHGPAGVASFLLGLHEATRDGRWLALAEEALSLVLSRAERRFGGIVFPIHDPLLDPAPGAPVWTYWCHGAAGIAFAFLEALRVTGDGRWREAARGCLGATDHFLSTHEVREAGQCHGVAGDLEPLIEGAAVLDDPALLERAPAHARRLLLPRLARLPADPSLMLGRAGVGQALLRLAEPRRVAHHGLALRPPVAAGR